MSTASAQLLRCRRQRQWRNKSKKMARTALTVRVFVNDARMSGLGRSRLARASLFSDDQRV